jgi:hypothetical protein
MTHDDFRAGEALSKSFSIWFKNLAPFTVLSMLVYSPLIAYTAFSVSGDFSLEDFSSRSLVVSWGSKPFDLVVAGAIVFGVFQQLRGRHASIGESIVHGVKRLLPVLGVGLLVLLAALGTGLLIVVPGLAVPSLLFLLGPAAMVAAVIVSMMLYVAVPVAVVEQPGVLAALRRSRQLTDGYRGRIFGALMIMVLIQFVVSVVVVMAVVGTVDSPADAKAQLGLSLCLSVVLGALNATLNAVIYHDLRRAKEGIGIEDLAKVFD